MPPELSFFFPSKRKHDLNHPTSILLACYQAFDHFDFNLDYSQCTIPILLQLPLKEFFDQIPEGHFLNKHPKFPAHNFFILEPKSDHHLLRLRTEHEYPEKKRSCYALYKTIMFHHTLPVFQPWVMQRPIFYSNIHDPTLLASNLDNLLQQVITSVRWRKFEPKVYRQYHRDQQQLASISTIHFKKLKYFWSLPVHLPAKNLWFRTLCKKLPTANYLHHIGTIESPQCRLCLHPTESLNHFVYTCPRKLTIWYIILGYYFPSFLFTEEMILQTIYSLQLPFPRRSNLFRPFYIIVATTQYYIWFYYWQHIIENALFNEDAIIKKIVEQLRILFHKQLYED